VVSCRILETIQRLHLSGNSPLLFTPALLAIQSILVMIKLFMMVMFALLFVILATCMFMSRNPRVPIHWLVLLGEVDTFTADPALTSLRKVASTRGQFGRDNSILRDPVCQRIFAVLDNRSAGLVAIVTGPCLSGGDGSLVNQLYKMLSESRDNRQLFAVLTKGIELVIERCLDLLTGDV
jgi:hypothetical protein